MAALIFESHMMLLSEMETCMKFDLMTWLLIILMMRLIGDCGYKLFIVSVLVKHLALKVNQVPLASSDEKTNQLVVDPVVHLSTRSLSGHATKLFGGQTLRWPGQNKELSKKTTF